MSYHPNPRLYGRTSALGQDDSKKEPSVRKLVAPDLENMSAYEAADIKLRLEREERQRKSQLWSNLASIASAVVPIVTLLGIDRYLKLKKEREKKK